MATEKEHLQQIIRNLPETPGVYRYYDKKGSLLYVGKAKNLKRRVSSYFTKSHDSARLRVLVRKIDDIQFIVVKTEIDALLLENNLIKKHRPRYNVMLRDDKTYPWICIKKEPFPRVFSTRRVIRDGSEYFGPYASVRVMRNLLELIRGIYPLRTCNFALTKENIDKGKFKVCLEYHIGNCLGPCEGLQEAEHYEENLKRIRQIIRGDLSEVKNHLKDEMNLMAEQLEFEKAQLAKEKLDLLERYQAKSMVVSPIIKNADVFSIITDVQAAFINYLKVVNGAVINSYSIELRNKLDETPTELLQRGFIEIRQLFDHTMREVYTNEPIDLEIEGINFHVPQRGDKKQLVDLSIRNAKQYRQDKLKQIQQTDPDRHTNRLMAQMKKDLRLIEEPRHIECFDNSNIQGSNPVAACVVFRDGKPAKKEYRHFNIKTVEGPDDFASMEEVVYRRYRRMLEEGASLPQLIVIDGGKGQLSSALKSLERLDLRGKVAIVGIAKRLEEIYFPGDSIPLYLDKKIGIAQGYSAIAERSSPFWDYFSPTKRSKGALGNALENIDGIGPSTAATLLKKFKSVKRIKNAEAAEIEAEVGKAKAILIQNAIREGKL